MHEASEKLVYEDFLSVLITYMIIYNNLGISGLQRMFKMVYITYYTEKGYTVPTEFRDHFDPSRSAITEPTKMDLN